MEKLILIGGGGHCRSCIDVIESEGKYEIEGIVDLSNKIGEKILSYEIIASDDDIVQLAKKYSNFLITIGQLRDPKRRFNLFSLLEAQKVNLPSIVSSNAYVSRHAKIGAGSIIMHGAIVNSNAVIGKNCIINSNALIEHDAVISDHCHIATSAVINGGVTVGELSFVGSGAITKQYIVIPSNSFIPAHSLMK
jgi:sugar O-acyltransferase (sialic acid O-acetyltransferase NeuD family)